MVNFDTFNKFINLLETNKIRYWISGGYALDGMRGKISREHGDIDLYLFYVDLDKFIDLCNEEKFSCYKKEQMFFVDSDGLEIGVVVVTEENGFFVANGNKTIVKYPRQIFDKELLGTINSLTFRVIPKEVLMIDSKYSRFSSDRNYGEGLGDTKELINKIEIIKVRD